MRAARRYRSSSFDRAQDRNLPRRIRIGVCARDKKVKAQSMTKILQCVENMEPCQGLTAAFLHRCSLFSPFSPLLLRPLPCTRTPPAPQAL